MVGVICCLLSLQASLPVSHPLPLSFTDPLSFPPLSNNSNSPCVASVHFCVFVYFSVFTSQQLDQVCTLTLGYVTFLIVAVKTHMYREREKEREEKREVLAPLYLQL